MGLPREIGSKNKGFPLCEIASFYYELTSPKSAALAALLDSFGRTCPGHKPAFCSAHAQEGSLGTGRSVLAAETLYIFTGIVFAVVDDAAVASCFLSFREERIQRMKLLFEL